MVREAVPDSRAVVIDPSNRAIFVAKEDDTVNAMLEFLLPEG